MSSNNVLRYFSLTLFLFLTQLGFAQFAPNQRIAFASDRDGNVEIYIMNADGTGQINLTNNPGYDDRPAMSPDGSKIAFQTRRDGNQEIYIMNSDGTDVTRPTFDVAYDFAPTFSPDGTKIAFFTGRTGNWEVFEMNLDGSNQVNLTNHSINDDDPAYSPDGSKILFKALRDGNYEIYVMNRDGSGQTNLTNNSYADERPVYSGDGNTVFFVSNRTGIQELHAMSLDGTNQHRLELGVIGSHHPTTSLDGSLAFSSAYAGASDIYLRSPDGSVVTNLTNSPWNDFEPALPLFFSAQCDDVTSPSAVIDLINPNPVFLGDSASISVQVSATDNESVETILLSIDGGNSWIVLDAADGAYGEAGETASYSFIQYELGVTAAGVYPVMVKAIDHCGNESSVMTDYIAVYDSAAGFVTGGGWIESPVGAYAGDTSATGRASFGFVGKIPRGKTAPEGEVEFNFPAVDLKFHGPTVSSLKVSKTGGLAEMRGSGALNGVTGFLYYLRAIDGTTDKFRLRIYTKQGRTETVYYDTVFDMSLGGGQIVIHR